MKLEDQVCSLELAKKLKDLGVKQESAFYWDNIITNQDDDRALWKIGDVISFGMEETYDSPSDHSYAAFTVAELGEMLDRHVNDVSWHTAGWRVWLDIARENYFKTEADARAFRLIHLIEQGIVKQ